MKVQKSLLRGKCTANFCCWAGDKECEQALWAAIQRLTLEQLGQAILELLSKSISQVSHLASVLLNSIKMTITKALLSCFLMLFHGGCCCCCDCPAIAFTIVIAIAIALAIAIASVIAAIAAVGCSLS